MHKKCKSHGDQVLIVEDNRILKVPKDDVGQWQY